MAFKSFTAAACALTALSGLAHAQEFSGAATLGYGHTSISNGGGDANGFTLDGTGTLAFGNGLFLGMDGSFATVDPDGPANDIDTTDLGLDLTYQAASGLTVGGYLDYADIDINLPGGLAADASVTSYGVKGGYTTASFGAEAHVGLSETSPSLPSGVDWTDYGLNLRYRPSERTQIGGHWVNTHLSGPGGSTDITSLGLGASHGFGMGWSAFAGLNWLDLDAANSDVTTFGLGVGYDLSQVTSVPAQLSLELARSNLDTPAGDAHADTIRLGVTLPLGDRGTSAPLNSVSRGVIAPRHNAISTLVDTSF